jgi:hypothetical protein
MAEVLVQFEATIEDADPETPDLRLPRVDAMATYDGPA